MLREQTEEERKTEVREIAQRERDRKSEEEEKDGSFSWKRSFTAFVKGDREEEEVVEESERKGLLKRFESIVLGEKEETESLLPPRRTSRSGNTNESNRGSWRKSSCDEKSSDEIGEKEEEKEKDQKERKEKKIEKKEELKEKKEEAKIDEKKEESKAVNKEEKSGVNPIIRVENTEVSTAKTEERRWELIESDEKFSLNA
jgi:hypothetical protein